MSYAIGRDRLVYETSLETEGRSGIMSVEIPLPTDERSKSLDSSTDYHWYLSYICNPEQRSQDVVLEGWIDRIELSEITQEKLETLSLTEQANLYQQQGIWHDALATAANQLQTRSRFWRWRDRKTFLKHNGHNSSIKLA